MELITSAGEIAINQMGTDFLLIEPSRIALAPGDAELRMCVNGRSRQWTIFLLCGIEVGCERVAITRVSRQ